MRTPLTFPVGISVRAEISACACGCTITTVTSDRRIACHVRDDRAIRHGLIPLSWTANSIRGSVTVKSHYRRRYLSRHTYTELCVANITLYNIARLGSCKRSSECSKSTDNDEPTSNETADLLSRESFQTCQRSMLRLHLHPRRRFATGWIVRWLGLRLT